MRARLVRWLTWLLDLIDPPYGTHVKAPGALVPAGTAAVISPPYDGGPLHRSSPSPPLRGRPVQSLSPEAYRLTQPIILALLEARPANPPPEWDTSVEALRQLHRALLAAA